MAPPILAPFEKGLSCRDALGDDLGFADQIRQSRVLPAVLRVEAKNNDPLPAVCASD